MAQSYFSLVTTAGKIKLAQSAAGGSPVVITHFAVGDGNGAETNPTAASAALVHEVWRTSVESVTTDPDNPAAILVTAIIPTNVGGWWMREFGIFSDDGTMIAVAKPVSQYKPTALEGQLEDIRYEFQIIIGESANVTLLVDPSLIFATREWVLTRRIPMAQMMRVPWLPVISMTLSSAPGAPALGDTYVIPANATGIWAANVGKLAEWAGTAWSYSTPTDGHGIGLPDGTPYVRVAGTYMPLAASQAEVDAGQVDNRFVTPASLAKEKASYMSASAGSQSIPSDVWTTITSFGTAPTNFRGASTFVSGVMKIGAGDEGLWALTLSVREQNLGQTGQASRIMVNNIAVASGGGQTSSDIAVGHSASAAALPLAVGDEVRWQIVQTAGSAKTFNEYNLSAARIGAA